MKLKAYLAAALVAAGFTAGAASGSVAAQAQTKTFINPVVDSDFPDVDIIRVDGYYYMLSTTMYHFPGATILRSNNMVDWEFYAQPLKRLKETDDYNLLNGKDIYAHGMWASGLKYHNGKYYILLNSQGLGSFIMIADDLLGDWKMKRLDHTYYDSNFLFDSDGKIYIVCGYNTIFITEVDQEWNYVRDKILIERPKTGLEGNHLYHIGDYYYLYCTYGGYPSGQTVFRSKEPFGDYEEKVLIEKRINGKVNTVHQGAMVQTQTGEWWSLLFEDEGMSGRQPHLQPVTWVDDWPIHGDNGVPYVECRMPNVGDASAAPIGADDKNLPAGSVRATEASDEFDSETLSMQWQWNHQPVERAWSLKERPGWLRLRTVGTAKTLKYARNSVTERIPGFKNKNPKTGTLKLDISNMKNGDVAGLSVFQDPYGYIAVKKDGRNFEIEWRVDSVRGNTKLPAENVKKTEIPGKTKEIYLQAKVDLQGGTAEYYYSLDGENYTRLGAEHKMFFNLSVFVGARFYIFNYATKKEGGFVDVDYFHYKELKE